MKNFLKLSFWLSLGAIFFVFSGCGEEGNKPENFKSAEDAGGALYEVEEDIFLMLYQLDGATDLAENFDGNYSPVFDFKTKPATSGLKKRLSTNTFGYNAQTGYWTFDTTLTDTALTLFANGKIKFTPRDLVTGLPNESTQTMQYDLTAGMSEQSGASYLDLNYESDLLLEGIAAFRAATGNIMMDGSEALKFSLDITIESEHIVGEYHHSYTINDVVISPSSNYPQSGNLTFTVKRTLNVDFFGEDFYVKGKITFDGSNIAVLEFGGYTFHINLNGPNIVEFNQTKPSGLRLNNTSQFYDFKFSK